MSLLFSSSSIDNTDISLSSDPRCVLFTVRSPESSSGVTTIHTGRGGAVLVILKERLLLSDTITFGEGSGCEKIKVDKWMKKNITQNQQ